MNNKKRTTLSLALAVGVAFSGTAAVGTASAEAPSEKAVSKLQQQFYNVYGVNFEEVLNKLKQNSFNWSGGFIIIKPLPTAKPTQKPEATPKPTTKPTTSPKPTAAPTAKPKPTAAPTATPKPTAAPTATPKPTAAPTATPKPTATPAPTAAPGGGQGESSTAFAQQVVSIVNQERAKQGLGALASDAALSKVAMDKAKDMYVNNYFSHTSPTYGSPFDMMAANGIKYNTAGENIAKGQRTPEEVMKAWMESPGHKANIMKSSYTSIGVAYHNGVWVQMFKG
ncbi:uncharacterized protein, YkwD family [Paenibacillaceae bacterium GAS479]|nr:uncharacterized protein, YkwD family [Paenibacillaceae bacterium GAS479]